MDKSLAVKAISLARAISGARLVSTSIPCPALTELQVIPNPPKLHFKQIIQPISHTTSDFELSGIRWDCSGKREEPFYLALQKKRKKR